MSLTRNIAQATAGMVSKPATAGALDRAAGAEAGVRPEAGRRGPQELHALVRWTSAAGTAAGMPDRAKAADGIGPATAETYGATVARRMDLAAPGGGKLMDGVSAASWHATKAALAWGAVRAWRDARRVCDQQQRIAKDKDKPEAERRAAWSRAWAGAERAAAAVEALERIESAIRPEPSAPRQTKRKTLPKMSTWQAEVYKVATPVQRPAVAVLWATGCRPAEIERGVDVVRDRHGRLIVVIPGAKVRDAHGAGQPQRALLIDEATEAGKVLAELLGDQRLLTVQRRAARLNKDFEAIREHLPWRISPYSMRHQVAANLKSELGPEGAEIVAAALGHRTTASQSRYGSVKQAQAGGGAIRAAEATHAVKETRARPGRSGPDKNADKPGLRKP